MEIETVLTPSSSGTEGYQSLADEFADANTFYGSAVSSVTVEDIKEKIKGKDNVRRSDSNLSSSSFLDNLKLDDELEGETRDLFIVVDNPEKHATAMESYITFRVTSKTTRSEFDQPEYCVRRRYNDFLWLRQKLELSNPTHLIPPLPEKHSFRKLDRFDPHFIKIRTVALQKFLNRIAEHPVLSFSNDFKMFLTGKVWEFQAHKKQGAGLLGRLTDSLHSFSASYMMKNRCPEHITMNTYISGFGEKLGTIDRISQRIAKEQTEYAADLKEFGPMFTLWSGSEDKLNGALAAMAKAVDVNLKALKDVIASTDAEICQPIKEYILYSDAIKAVLRRRDAIQMEYELTIEELNRKKDERDHVRISDQNYSFGAFIGKDPSEVKQHKQDKLETSISELKTTVEELNDKATCANADLKADMDRWEKSKRRDFKRIFISLADRQIEYYQKCLKAWEEAIPSIHKTDNQDDQSSASSANAQPL
ncbi:sorting nexin-30-like [Tubulanus polymorphus]|uniref:sorting nexin-30-like n=1 Tax=Tubulanus polymorphus TaxID=672921 RepID=UPI003DA3FDD5